MPKLLLRKNAFMMAVLLHLVVFILLLLKYFLPHSAQPEQMQVIHAVAVSMPKLPMPTPVPEVKPEPIQPEIKPKPVQEEKVISKPEPVKPVVQAPTPAPKARPVAKPAVQPQAKPVLSIPTITPAMATLNSKEIDRYRALITAAISRYWIVPPNLAPNISAQIQVRLAPGGEVLEVQLIKSSGVPVLDESALAAVNKASPLPVPSDFELFDQFRDLRLTVRPQGVISM